MNLEHQVGGSFGVAVIDKGWPELYMYIRLCIR
jgi:hypothetical protein